MKKVIVFLLIVSCFMLLISCASQGSTEDQKNDETENEQKESESTQNREQENEQVKQEESKESEASDGYITTPEALEKELDKLLDLDKYDVRVDEYKLKSGEKVPVPLYTLKDKSDATFSDSYVWFLGDGTQLGNPTTYKDMIKAGWTLNPRYTLKETDDYRAKSFGDVHFVKGDKKVTMIARNTSDQPVKVKDLKFYGFDQEYYDSNKKQISENISVETVKGFSNKSSFADIIKQFGLPTTIQMYSNGASGFEHATIILHYNDTTSGIAMEFYVLGETDVIRLIQYEGAYR